MSGQRKAEGRKQVTPAHPTVQNENDVAHMISRSAAVSTTSSVEGARAGEYQAKRRAVTWDLTLSLSLRLTTAGKAVKYPRKRTGSVW